MKKFEVLISCEEKGKFETVTVEGSAFNLDAKDGLVESLFSYNKDNKTVIADAKTGCKLFSTDTLEEIEEQFEKEGWSKDKVNRARNGFIEDINMNYLNRGKY